MANSETVMAMIRLARPPFRNNHDKVAFAIHASFISSGYILTATGRPAFADDALSSSSSSSQDDVGIDGWNEFEGEYAFVYANPKKGSKKILVKCLAIDEKLVVDAIADGGAEPAHLEIKVEDYAQESNEGNYAAQFKNLDKLVSDLQSGIVDKLDGKPKPVSSRTQSSSETHEEPRYYDDTPNPLGPQIHPSGVVVPPIPGNGGYSDLFPGPGAGMYPGRGGFGDGSMLVGPGDPRFFPFGDGSDRPGFMGPPQPGVPPPGARFDPYGPPGVPGFEPGRFTRQPPRRPGGGHPDLEHFPGGSDFI
ncbi:PREDICTED: probable proteasome inhibitor [Camelina sativa]|uniref:Probable proteasome inhibitor n=1 Tax=Camelina sativa TaxID=90675 RepID=A0ABM0YPX2_CAMSA|nr:PREDICTED: probable proteasome inhibitor [Camelina sativa]